MKRIILFLITMFFACVVLSVSQATAQDDPHYLWIPYNVDGGGFWTGLNIKTYWFNETLEVYFSGPSDTYASAVQVDLDSRGRWTGLVQNLLPNPESFQTPTLLRIQSSEGPFSVTQFLGNASGGFAFQTFYSAQGTGALESWPFKQPDVLF